MEVIIEVVVDASRLVQGISITACERSVVAAIEDAVQRGEANGFTHELEAEIAIRVLDVKRQ